MPYGIELSFNDKAEIFQLPVMPGSLEISEAISSKTYDIVGLREINVIKNLKLSQYGFSSLFPAQRYPFVTVQTLLQPIEYVRFIVKWMESAQPIRFIFISDRYNINTLASIESFDWKEVAGGAGDIDYNIKLKMYVPYTAQKVEISSNPSAAGVATTAAPARPDETQQPKTYTLVAGDTLWAVAKQFLGNGARWPEIQRINDITDAEIKRLQIGRVLKLP
ncbi:LysM peptidoglycan-binding domain-containing protein [Desulfosporosinus meridiei]|uniref:LysM domain-containing protein n=1 Tax=Desulfosporosinus meridiei (strain ATCC BAA-275 / DSM 13257 / KCTC 12902 / NCIMB 13706 / S10) TaxID=768704 RepID=J7IYD3_DESMD|nr:LysM peptidoglycan-binding domain-containing protein [Desulfosporosinus meridiei]AFQ45154.1 LysM domain-containing protein [Desulfosporosinus meridiei DSM 13257]